MSLDLFIAPDDEPQMRADLEERYLRVAHHFAFPEDARILCFLPREIDASLLTELGASNRGFQLSVADYYSLPFYIRVPKQLPSSLENALRHDDGRLKNDTVIYVQRSTAVHPEGLIVTLAHELQHARQSFECREIMNESSMMAWERRSRRAEFINVPHEKEAMFVSRAIAEVICGRRRIEKYIQEQLEGAQQELVRWKYLADWENGFSLEDEMESARREHRRLTNGN
jgi:hypothetical protein